MRALVVVLPLAVVAAAAPACTAMRTPGSRGACLASGTTPPAHGGSRPGEARDVRVYSLFAYTRLADVINTEVLGPEAVVGPFPKENAAVARIRREVEPRFWLEHPGAEIESWGGHIVVVATPAMHCRVLAFLRATHPVVSVEPPEGE